MDVISNKMRDVRVTERVSIGRDFIAPELSPVRLVDQEMVKGLRGWTSEDKVTDLTGEHLPKGFAERQLEELTIGIAPRRAAVKRSPRRVRKGPSALKLAAR
ncbi:hypothetical protein ASE48_08475 [Mycobacterium sp. Root265]|uniref:hypothetical protein n=1 Tax=Mycobacterium sp. Root265 TaxID=1736504 RepID=UPI000709BB39|nr:hypothetical protein [Mycobacterium sp. Root265]KRD08589.1 hypothetical protein ASE48_08475 [Mycobacterium sp. Root265]